MRHTRHGESSDGPSEWFTGKVSMEPVAQPDGAYRISATNVKGYCPHGRDVEGPLHLTSKYLSWVSPCSALETTKKR